MLGIRRSIELAVVALAFAVVLLPEAAAKRYAVGDNGTGGWTQSGGNYSNWTQGKHFYNGDWLFFVYDRNQYQVLEVNITTYYNCTLDRPLHNFTGGVGRDVVALNQTRPYYFISSVGYCFGGMKLLVDVENPPSPQSSPPHSRSGSPSSLMSTLRSQALVPALLTAAAVWDSFLLLL